MIFFRTVGQITLHVFYPQYLFTIQVFLVFEYFQAGQFTQIGNVFRNKKNGFINFFKVVKMNIYVGNLPFNLGEEDLKEIFEEYGEVSSVKIISDKFSGRSKGFGFVEMDSDDEANNAIKELNNAEVGGRNIKVNESKPRENNRGGDRRGGGGGYQRRERY
jgi:RNA recognition motif-containing protein